MSGLRFEFGDNWKNYVENYLDDDKIREAEKSLKSFMGLKDLRGKTFLDIGCGTGMFSLAAFNLGAKVISFDFDANSVECCKLLRERFGNDKRWEIRQGSVLSKKFMNSLPQADIVYSWGVLHHTGKMYEAIRSASEKVKPKGLFLIAIYNKVGGRFGSKFSLNVKKAYNKSPAIIKNLMVFSKIIAFFMYNMITMQNPLKKISSYKSKRGMSWYYDIVDGMGGYPFDYASAEEIFTFCRKLGFSLINIKTTNGKDNNEFLFKKQLF